MLRKKIEPIEYKVMLLLLLFRSNAARTGSRTGCSGIAFLGQGACHMISNSDRLVCTIDKLAFMVQTVERRYSGFTMDAVTRDRGTVDIP